MGNSLYRSVNVGDKFGIIEVIGEIKFGPDKAPVCECKCECGNIKTVRVHSFFAKHKPRISCGCLRGRREGNPKHGLKYHPLYSVWCGMKQRCLDTKSEAFPRYGGRGIKICEEWMDVSVFIGWAVNNGWMQGLTLDRRDNEGDYNPQNCEFVTYEVNNGHTRRSVMIQAFGEKKCMSAWARDPRCAVPFGTLQQRIYRGMDQVVALTTPRR